MDYTIKHLEYKLKISFKTIRVYLCRAEFNHIKQEVRRVKNQEIKYITNITAHDLMRLEKLISTRRTLSKKPKETKPLDMDKAKRVFRKLIKILYTDINDVMKVIKIEDELFKIKELL